MMKIYKKLLYIFTLTAAIFIVSCSKETDSSETIDRNYNQVPSHFPPIPFPASNPYSPEKFELGRMLFYEKLLSKDTTIASCSHCMKQENSFCDNIPMSFGLDSIPETRNTMSLCNVAYRNTLFWDGRGSSIESPAYRSIFLPNILGSDTNVVKKRLSEHPLYPEMFRKAFGANAETDCYLAAQAIATFVRTLVSGNSKYDSYLRGNSSALNESEMRGMQLFNSSRCNCSVCHSGLFFTDLKFHNTGTTTHYFDRGRYYVTKDLNDRGLFLTPSLRNVEFSAPYMHNGEYSNLYEIIENYNRGGRAWFNRSTLLKPLNLTVQEKQDIIAFLKSLSDKEFISNKKFSNPFKNR